MASFFVCVSPSYHSVLCCAMLRCEYLCSLSLTRCCAVAAASGERHDLRIRVAARGVVYIIGRAMPSRLLWLVGSDLVRFALLDRGIIAPTFKFKLPCNKATVAGFAKHKCEHHALCCL